MGYPVFKGGFYQKSVFGVCFASPSLAEFCLQYQSNTGAELDHVLNKAG